MLKTMMTELKEQQSERYLQNAPLTTPWYLTFRSIALKEKQVSKNMNRLALNRSAELDKIIIPPKQPSKVIVSMNYLTIKHHVCYNKLL